MSRTDINTMTPAGYRRHRSTPPKRTIATVLAVAVFTACVSCTGPVPVSKASCS
jgi:hypothetical protein